MRPKLFGAAMAAALLIGTAALADCNPNDRESQTGNANTTRCDSGTPSSATGRGMGTNSGGNNAPMKGAPYNGSGTDGGTNKGTYGGSTPNTTTPGSGSGDATGGAGSGPSSLPAQAGWLVASMRS